MPFVLPSTEVTDQEGRAIPVARIERIVGGVVSGRVERGSDTEAAAAAIEMFNPDDS